MDIQGLKDKILQLAIQGKLVEQDPNDEPASALLERIKEERDKLVREGKIRKPKKLAPIEQEEKLFEIPEGWEWVRLGEVALINMGQSPKGDSVNDNQGMEFHQGKVCFGDRYINKSDKYTTSPQKIAQPGDILLSVRAPVGTINMTDREVCIGRGLCAISNLGDTTNDYYFYAIIALEKYLIARATGTTFLAVTASTVNEMIIPLPPLAEQKRIVEKVDQLFALIDELDSNKENLLEVINLTRNQVLQEAIQGKLVEQNPEDEPAPVLLDRIKEERDKLVKEKKIRKPKKLPPIEEEEKPFDVPEGWEWVRLGEVGDWGSGATPKRSNPKYYENGTIPWLKTGELNDGYIKYSEEHITEEAVKETSVRMNQIGDVLIAMYGATIGRLGILEIEATTNQACCACTPFMGVFNRYLFYYLLSQRKSFKDKSEGGAQPNISKEKIVNHFFPLPPLAEQKRIVEKVDIIMNILDELENELTTKHSFWNDIDE